MPEWIALTREAGMPASIMPSAISRLTPTTASAILYFHERSPRRSGYETRRLWIKSVPLCSSL